MRCKETQQNQKTGKVCIMKNSKVGHTLKDTVEGISSRREPIEGKVVRSAAVHADQMSEEQMAKFEGDIDIDEIAKVKGVDVEFKEVLCVDNDSTGKMQCQPAVKKIVLMSACTVAKIVLLK